MSQPASRQGAPARHAPHPAMQVILEEMRAANLPDLTRMPLPEARAAFDANAANWNRPMPAMEVQDLALGGVPCRLLLPAEHRRGLVVFAHGGGWTFGSPATHARFASLLAEAAGVAVLMPDYRLAPEHPCPAGIEDVLAVLRHARDLPQAAGVDADTPVVLCGDSAGANIALATGLALARGAGPGGSRVAGLSLLYGCFAPVFDTESHAACGDGSFGLSTARMQWFWDNWMGRGGHGTEPDPRAAPLHVELAGLPPVHLLAAGLDCLRDDSILLAGRLAAQGVPFRLDVVPGVIHGFLQMTARLPPAMEAMRTAADWIRARLDAADGR